MVNCFLLWTVFGFAQKSMIKNNCASVVVQHLCTGAAQDKTLDLLFQWAKLNAIRQFNRGMPISMIPRGFSMVTAKRMSRILPYAAALSMILSAHPVQAQPADSDLCVLADYLPGIGQPYFQHNEVVMGNYDGLMHSFRGAESRGSPTGRKMRRIRQALEENPGLDRLLLPIVIAPRSYSDYNRSCERQTIHP